VLAEAFANLVEFVISSSETGLFPAIGYGLASAVTQVLLGIVILWLPTEILSQRFADLLALVIHLLLERP
jgi:phosphate/sulfate permease